MRGGPGARIMPIMDSSIGSSGSAVVAVWIPHWYNLDPPISVGTTDCWTFYGQVPPALEAEHDQLLADQPLLFQVAAAFDENPENAISLCGTIAKIAHPQLGELKSVNTDRFGIYEFALADGTTIQVEAEEGPGKAYDAKVVVDDWSVRVWIDPDDLPPPRT